MVCAVKQHTGKTSVSMALQHNLRRHFERTGGTCGFMKPVGQQWVEVVDKGESLRVDKDAALAYDFFKLTDPIGCVSPIVIGRGDTKAFLDNEMPDLADEAFAARLIHAYDTISASNDFVVVEGTGHCGVGAVLGWTNARVAATLGVDIVLVANGGVGSTFDELALNVEMCRAANARMAGIIINKCAPHKVGEVQHYLQRAADRFGWGLPVLAVVPYGEDLDKPSIADLVHCFEGGFSQSRSAPSADHDARGRRVVKYEPEKGASALPSISSSLASRAAAAYAAGVRAAAGYGVDEGEGVGVGGGQGGGAGVGGGLGAAVGRGEGTRWAERPAVLLAGREHLQQRFAHYELVTTSLGRFMEKLTAMEGSENDAGRGVCFVTHISRSDIIHGLLGHRALMAQAGRDATAFGAGLIIAGSEQSRPLERFEEEYIALANMPVLRSHMPMTQTLAAIKGLTPKMQAEDDRRVRQVIDLYAPHLEGAVQRLVSERPLSGR